MRIAKVLLIDDEGEIRQLARMALSALGPWCVVEAASGAEGVALAASERPDVILLDVMMPVLDGPATFGQLRAAALAPVAPVIFMTARTRPEEVEHLIALGAAGVITKPFDPMTLAAEIRRIVDQLPE